MSTQPKEGLAGDFNLEGYYKDKAGHGFIPASSEYVATTIAKRFFTANRKMRIKAANLTVTVAGTDGSAVTMDIKKVPSGTTIAGGTSILSAAANLKGTADTNQALGLTATESVLLLDRGDSLALVPTGTLTSATGVATVVMSPA